MGKLTIEKLTHEVKNEEFNCGVDSINSQICQSYFPSILHHCNSYECKMKDITLICFRVYMEVYVIKSPTCFSRWSVSSFLSTTYYFQHNGMFSFWTIQHSIYQLVEICKFRANLIIIVF